MAGYQDRVRNLLINYTAKTSKDIAFRYLHKKANVQVAALDHDYCKLPYTEYWIDRSLDVGDNDIHKIEQSTRGQSQSKKWFNKRSQRITASRFGEICRITDRRNKYKLCASIGSSQKFNNVALSHGKNYEKKAINQFEKKMNVSVKECGLFVCKQKGFLGATPDAVIDDNFIVEVKCPYSGRDEKIVPGKLFPFLKEEDGKVSLRKDCPYYDQVQGQLLISQRKYCYFVVYTFVDLFVDLVKINEEYCNFCLIPKLESFYVRHFRPYLASML